MVSDEEMSGLTARLEARVGAEGAEQVTRLHMLYQVHCIVHAHGTDHESKLVSDICQSFTVWYISRHVAEDRRESFCRELDWFIRDVEALQDAMNDEARLADGEVVALAESLISKVRR